MGALNFDVLGEKTRTATRSYRTRKRACHFYSPGVVRRSHTAARQVLYGSAAAAAGAVVYMQLI